MSELKPCPFCGGEVLIVFADKVDVKFNNKSVSCGHCSAKAPLHNWNTRCENKIKRRAAEEILALHEQDRAKVNSQCDTLINISTVEKYLEGLK